MNSFTVTPLGSGAEFVAIPSERFKTTGVSVLMRLPMEPEKVSSRALAVQCMSRTSAEYPTVSAMKRRLAMLYGASLGATVGRTADAQSLMLTVTSLSDRFALDGSSLAMECAQLLCGALFRPATENGLFREDSVALGKRMLRESIEAQRSDKIMYSLERCIEETYAGEPAGCDPYGTIEGADAATPESVTQAWRELLDRAQIYVFAVGEMDFGAVRSVFEKEFSKRKREYAPFVTGAPSAKAFREADEPADAVQSKLVLSWSMPTREGETAVGELLSACFGGSPSSRLFRTVREQLSLCYYCSSMYVRRKETMFVYSGLETDKLDEARAEIARQIEWIADGKLTDDEIEAARLALANRYASAGESVSSITLWYSRQLPETMLSPEEMTEQVMRVTPQQLAGAAAKMKPQLAYILRGRAQPFDAQLDAESGEAEE